MSMFGSPYTLSNLLQLLAMPRSSDGGYVPGAPMSLAQIARLRNSRFGSMRESTNYTDDTAKHSYLDPFFAITQGDPQKRFDLVNFLAGYNDLGQPPLLTPVKGARHGR